MSAEEALFQKFGHEYPKGTVLFREGEPGKEMFVIQTGKVTISKKVRDLDTNLAVLGPGEFFGEMAIISNRPRNATATISEDAKILVIDHKTFEAMIRGNAEIAVRMIKQLAERLSEADVQIESLLMDPRSRIVNHLLQLCQRHGRPKEVGIEIEFPIRDLPAYLGVGEPALRSLLDGLVHLGLIHRNGDRVTVFDTARLQDYLRYLELKWKYGDL
jgi:CRP-like cAMP-binding protein